jgi:putative flippase GtrA
MISVQFVKFVVAGGVAAVVNFGSRILLSRWMAYVPAIVVAYCIGMLTAFIINKLFVFQESEGKLHHQASWFVAVNIAAVLQTVVISVAFAEYLFPYFGMGWHREAVAHAIGLAVPVFTSYVGHKYLTFRTEGSGLPLGRKGS